MADFAKRKTLKYVGKFSVAAVAVSVPRIVRMATAIVCRSVHSSCSDYQTTSQDAMSTPPLSIGVPILLQKPSDRFKRITKCISDVVTFIGNLQRRKPRQPSARYYQWKTHFCEPGAQTLMMRGKFFTDVTVIGRTFQKCHLLLCRRGSEGFHRPCIRRREIRRLAMRRGRVRRSRISGPLC